MADIKKMLQEYIKTAITAAEHGAEECVTDNLKELASPNFVGQDIVFDLQDNYWGPMVKEMIEKLIGQMSQSFQDRVSFVE